VNIPKADNVEIRYSLQPMT